jgi:hypothetical protein
LSLVIRRPEGIRVEFTTISILELGFTLSRSLLLMERREVSPELLTVRDYIHESTAAIQATINAATQKIIDKIEHDQLELLISRTQNLSSLVKLNRLDQVLHYSMTLRETVDYAQNRHREGKNQWLGPYLAGNSVLLAALRLCDALSFEDLERFDKFVAEARLEVLNQSLPALLESGRLPWVDIAKYVEGRSDEVIPKQIKSALAKVEKNKIDAEIKPKADGCAVLLATSAALAGSVGMCVVIAYVFGSSG